MQTIEREKIMASAMEFAIGIIQACAADVSDWTMLEMLQTSRGVGEIAILMADGMEPEEAKDLVTERLYPEWCQEAHDYEMLAGLYITAVQIGRIPYPGTATF